jgi:histidine ammonia-lyase
MTVILAQDHDLDIAAVEAIVDGGASVSLAAETAAALDGAFERFSTDTQERSIYGVNTGLGPLVRVAIPRDDLVRQQRQLLLSHAAGVGDPLTPRLARAVALARANSLARNRSAVRAALPELLCALLNADVAPWVPRHGGVGASGDLVQLAHLGLLMVGEGEAWLEDEAVEASFALRRAGVEPLDLRFRDALAICNGTSAMTGVAATALVDAERLLSAATLLSAAIAHLVGLDDEPYAEALQGAKQHEGQATVAAALRRNLEGRDRTRTLRSGARPLQEHYSIRCVPQILGTIVDVVGFARTIVLRELNSASDNPVFLPNEGEILHGGNFHGEPVAQAADSLKVALVKLSLLWERQVNFLLNDDINGFLPAFLNRGVPGVTFGLQGAQFTATSTAAHAQSLAFPMSVHSISCNKDNQDIVSMGCDAALMAFEVVGNAATVGAILALAVREAIEATDGWAGQSSEVRRFFEEVVPSPLPTSLDRPLSRDIGAVRERLLKRAKVARSA